MKVTATLFIVLGVFVLVSGAILGLWGGGPEIAGAFYLVVLGCAFAYLAKESREYGDEPADVDEPETDMDGGAQAVEGAPAAHDVSYHASAPTITPLLFAIGAGIIVTGMVFYQWLVFLGGGTLAIVAIAWFLETGRRRAAEEAAKAGHGHGPAPEDHAAGA
jgi:membrane protein implicated in regulation of membrane protease activity